MLQNLLVICVVIAIVIILVRFLKINIRNVSIKIAEKTFSQVGNVVIKIHDKNIQKAKISNKPSFAKSKLYKTVSQMIFDLGWDSNVEGFLFLISLGAVIINLALFVFLKSIFLFITGTFGTAVLLYTLAYMLASEGHFKREFAIMDAIDIIIVNMHAGVYKAVKEQIGLIDETIRPDFVSFLDDINEYKIPIQDALDNLADKLGPSFYKFKDKAKEFELKGRAGMLETFADDMNENMYKRMDMHELLETLREVNMAFSMALGICLILAFAVVGSNTAIIEFLFHSLFGQVLIVFNFLLIVAAFAYIQSLRK